MDTVYLYAFVLNVVLALCDASMGYHLAPVIGRVVAGDNEEAERTTRVMRKLLSGVVVLYVFLNCIAYSRKSLIFLLVVTAIIVLDMVGQLLVRHKFIRKMRD